MPQEFQPLGRERPYQAFPALKAHVPLADLLPAFRPVLRINDTPNRVQAIANVDLDDAAYCNPPRLWHPRARPGEP